jgi:hypothetical protein
VLSPPRVLHAESFSVRHQVFLLLPNSAPFI